MTKHSVLYFALGLLFITAANAVKLNKYFKSPQITSLFSSGKLTTVGQVTTQSSNQPIIMPSFANTTPDQTTDPQNETPVEQSPKQAPVETPTTSPADSPSALSVTNSAANANLSTSTILDSGNVRNLASTLHISGLFK